jgi:asparagine synthase (glutamine-hydrolysing)
VKAEMVSDVPIGAFLSGGIDSPLVTLQAQKMASESLKSFTIGSDSKVNDESEDARWYGSAIGTQLNSMIMNSSVALSMFDEVMNSLYEPFADFSIIPTYAVSRLAKEKVTVALSGDGGDELFFGYERFLSILKNLPYRRMLKGWTLRYSAYAADRVLFGKKHINENILHDKMSGAHFTLHSRFDDSDLNSIFPDLSKTSIAGDYVYDYPDSNSLEEMLWQMQKAEFYGMMQKTLTKVDRASMANSLEVRVPFLKKSFIEEALKISPTVSYSVEKKKLLKDLLRRELPGAPIDNKKRGFTVPLGKWIKEELKTEFENSLFDSSFIGRFGINENGLRAIFNRHLKGERDYKWVLFTLYSLSRWDAKRKKEIKPVTA